MSLRNTAAGGVRTVKYGSSLKTGAAFGLMLGLMIVGIKAVGGGELAEALPTAAVTAIFGGIFMGLYMRAHNRRHSDALDSVGKTLSERSTILLSDAAGHYRGGECIGGKLWLTDKELHFASFPGEMNSHSLSIPLSDIKSLSPLKTAGIRNGFSAETEEGIERFAVSRSAKWLEAVTTEAKL